MRFEEDLGENYPHIWRHLTLLLLRLGGGGLVTKSCPTSVVSDSLWSHGLQPAKILCSWDSPVKNTGVACHFLLQGIFSTPGSNSYLLHWQADSLLSHQGGLEIYLPNVKMLWEVISESRFSFEKVIFLCLLKQRSKYMEIVKSERRRMASTHFLKEKLTSRRSSLTL